MKNFSYIWIFTIFILQIMNVGSYIGKLGKENKTTYSVGLLIGNIIFSVISGLAVYWFPKE